MAQAQACLSHAHQLAPEEDYILKHLQIVQTRIAKLKNSVGSEKEKEIAFAYFDPIEFTGRGNIDLLAKDNNLHDQSSVDTGSSSKNGGVSAGIFVIVYCVNLVQLNTFLYHRNNAILNKQF